MSAPEQKLSQVSSVDGHSPRGFINGVQNMKSLKFGAVIGLLGYISTAGVIEVLSSFGQWYKGPFRESLAGIVAVGLTFLAAKVKADRMIEKDGEE